VEISLDLAVRNGRRKGRLQSRICKRTRGGGPVEIGHSRRGKGGCRGVLWALDGRRTARIGHLTACQPDNCGPARCANPILIQGDLRGSKPHTQSVIGSPASWPGTLLIGYATATITRFPHKQRLAVGFSSAAVRRLFPCNRERRLGRRGLSSVPIALRQ
jgi:hypothetical protein